MILEGVVTTLAENETAHIAPMGPLLEVTPGDVDWRHFVLRPFKTAQTYSNLVSHPEGVLHVTDDVLLLARAAVGARDPVPPVEPAARVRGWRLRDCCRWYEFRISARDDRAERARLEADVVHVGWVRDFFGLNRAMHAVVEAAILATRLALLPREEVEASYRKLAVLVDKTGGPRERAAFTFLEEYVRKHRTPEPEA
jgi:hypothetical protein